jgi:hypothetical protein
MAKGKKETKKELNAYILPDRSGSMANRWAESVSSINAYVQELAKGRRLDKFVMAILIHRDSGNRFDQIADICFGKF